VDFDPVKAKMAGEPYPLPDTVMALFPDALVESELGMIPKGWEVEKLSKFIEIFDSERVPLSKRERAKRKGKYPYYGATKIIDYVDDFIFEGRYVLMGEDGSVIIEKGNPVLQYVWGKFWANNHAHVLQGKNGFSTEFLYLLLMETNITPYITGAVQLKLNQKNLKSIPIIFPSEESLLVFDSIIQVFFGKLRKNSEEVEILIQIRDVLIQKI
jgi:type I restriction enzyme S subunit